VHRGKTDQRVFDHSGHGYDAVARLLARRLYRGVAAEVAAGRPPAGASLLDIGTGPGRLLSELAALRPDLRLTGIDLSPSMIAVARERLATLGPDAPIRLDVGDGGQMPYPDQSFDLVVSTVSMHHWQEPGRVVADAHRVLRPGGRFWVYDFALKRFQVFAASVEATFGTPPTRDVRWFGPLGLPLIVRLAAVR
jgi:ubiquinone/menaquinone biosynthesis C-methylase UbiE